MLTEFFCFHKKLTFFDKKFTAGMIAIDSDAEENNIFSNYLIKQFHK